MNLVSRFVMFSLACVLLAGCANYGSEEHFDRSSSSVDAKTALVGQPGRATVYLFRQRAFMQQFVYIPIPPMYYAVDGTMVSIMPLGSHVVLSLEPGRHTFTRFKVGGGGLFPIEVDRVDVQVELASDQIYYVGTRNGYPTQPFDAVDARRGMEIIADTELAKVIHKPATVDTFMARMAAAEAKRKAASSFAPTGLPPTQRASSPIESALPSSQQIGEFLDVVAAIALVAVLLVGAAADASSGPGATPALASPSSPPAIASPSPPQRQLSTETWRTSSGTLAEVLQSKESTVVRDIASGVRYEIESGRITGSDGSRYRVVGSNVYSDSGVSYQVIGNNVFASDGRKCEKIGVNVSCR